MCMRDFRELLCCLMVGSILVIVTCGAIPREKARLTLCESNLKVILQKMHSYVEDNEVMPPVWTQRLPAWSFWCDQVDPMNAYDPVFACPEDSRNSRMFEPADPLVPQLRRLAAASYGMNEKMHTYNSKTRRATMNDFVCPEKLIIFGDALIPMLQPVQNPGVKRHFGKFHYITAAGAFRLYTAEDLGGAVNGRYQYHPEEWHPWR